MNIFKTYLTQLLFFKQARFLLSEPDQSTHCVYISDTGIISRKSLPTETAFMSMPEMHKTWKVEHPLKIGIKNKHGVTEDEAVFLISDRDYVPLDVFGKLTARERNAMQPLRDIARIRHAEARINAVSNGDDPRTKLFNAVTSWSWLVIALAVLASQLGGC